MNEIIYNYSRINNKGIILLPKSLRININPKMESLMIKLKNINKNVNKKINFSRNDSSYLSLQPNTTRNSKEQEECVSSTRLKVALIPESISKQYQTCFIFWRSTESLDFNIEDRPWLWFCNGISRKLRDTPFLSSSLVQQEIQWWHSKLHAKNIHLHKIRTRAYMII